MKLTLKKKDEEFIMNTILGMCTIWLIGTVLTMLIMFMQFKIFADVVAKYPSANILVDENVKDINLECTFNPNN